MFTNFAAFLSANIGYVFAVCIVLCIVFGTIAYIKAKTIDKKTNRMSEKAFKNDNFLWISVSYTCCTTLISIFPLLGMLGTVVALISLDLGSEIESMRANFFQALDTTMWGLICAIIGKLINSFMQPYIETQEEKARQLYIETQEEKARQLLEKKYN